jgi:hypothetical protein
MVFDCKWFAYLLAGSFDVYVCERMGMVSPIFVPVIFYYKKAQRVLVHIVVYDIDRRDKRYCDGIVR